MYPLQPQIKPKRAALFPIWPILLVTMLVIVGGFAGLLMLRQAVPQVANVASDSDACYMAQKFVKEQLKSPSTAEFAPCRQPDTVVTRTERLWTVRSWVDAENSFGANLRNDFTAKLIYYPATDTWTLADSSLASR